MSTDELLEKADQQLQFLDKSCRLLLETVADLKQREIANRCSLTQRTRFEQQCKLAASYAKLIIGATEIPTK